MNTRVKRLVLPLGGTIAAAAMIGAGLAAPASAAPVVATDQLAANPAVAYSAAEFWLKSQGDDLKRATQYAFDYKAVKRHTLGSSGAPASDGKPGLIGQSTAPTSKVKNVNLPKTTGKVFFLKDGKAYWCTGSSIQSKYGNLVATAGHCVYDVDGNKDVLDKWIFIPGYYQGKAPWGVYVGKQAFTHYDFDVYEDFDKNYAFVNVYNGFSLGDKQVVSKADYDKWIGDKWIDKVKVDQKAYDEWLAKGGTGEYKSKVDPAPVGPDYPGAVYAPKEVIKSVYDATTDKPEVHKPGAQAYVVNEPVTEAQYKAHVDDKKADKDKPRGTKSTDGKGNYFISHYFVKQWVKPGADAEWYIDKYVIGKAVDRGTLHSNVGSQGFAWNQKLGIPVFVFGYPGGEHPDGNRPYSGTVLKWAYGKTVKATALSLKAEELVGIKSGALTGGSDGGPWIYRYTSAKRLGYINGVTGVIGDTDKNERWDTVASAYFDGETKGVYDKAAALWSGKIVGPNGEVLK
ncbi:trypsin-like serine peptidase [Sinosporangium siamense]|uniref:V8-like Glu-specific endopeptidase n=1 Tax=Sinosporangium siamense TaxID=1367973 RepID=A0A919RHJ5_9ACTN|nr:hypothetical protein [Sinosporangium siamense]GII92519.1 hypothetical protein Ssi02_27500 [Sinosporangium siamense]